MTIALSVNLNKVALLRNSRTDNNPSLSDFAHISIDAGALGLTAHPRPDQRHIRSSDIPLLSTIARQRNVEFNIEGNPFAEARTEYPGLLNLVKQVQPDQCTLVPDSDAQLTSDHGFDLKQDGERLLPIIEQLKGMGVRVSLFMDPIETQIKHASELGADRIELYTGPFAAAFKASDDTLEAIFDTHTRCAEYAHSLGLGVNAGHDLNQDNLSLYRQLPWLQEVSIGHALTADALHDGFATTVRNYVDVLKTN